MRALAEGWTQEYGIIYRPNPTPAVQKYIDLAVWLYANGQSARNYPAKA